MIGPAAVSGRIQIRGPSAGLDGVGRMPDAPGPMKQLGRVVSVCLVPPAPSDLDRVLADDAGEDEPVGSIDYQPPLEPPG